MSRVIAILAVLSLSATAFAAPTLTIDVNSVEFLVGQREVSPGNLVDTMEFNVVLTGIDGLPTTGDPLNDYVTGLGLGSTLSGASASHLIAVGVLNQNTATVWDGMITGDYLFADLASIGSNSSKTGGGVLTHIMVDDRPRVDPLPPFDVLGLLGVEPTVGSVVARVIYYWDGTAIPDFSVNINLTTDGDTGGTPYLLTNAGQVACDVANNGVAVPIPEPATMGLLGLGLLGLVIRRKK